MSQIGHGRGTYVDSSLPSSHGGADIRRGFGCGMVFIGIGTTSAHAAPRPGAKCTQVGKVVKAKNTTLVCVQRGKKKVWRKQRASTPAAQPAVVYSSDPVTAKIQRRMADLPMPDRNAAVGPMRYIIENPADERWVPRLNEQFTVLAQAYPEFTWSKQGITIMPRTEGWLVETMRSLGCGEQAISRTRVGFYEGSPIWGKGATDCNDALGPVAIISNLLPVDQAPYSVWDYMVAAEFTEVIRENRFAMSPQPMNGPVPMRYYNVGMPSWMREGVEPIFYAVAQAKQSRVWSYEHPDPRKTCGTEILRDYSAFMTDPNGCHYVLGYAANELMLALYGWDAPLLWWSSFGTQQDPYVAFKNAYGDDYETFERYTREFVRWRAYQEPMSAELLARLA